MTNTGVVDHNTSGTQDTMVLCSCFRPSARYENEVETSAPQIITHDLDVAKQVS